LVSGFNRGLGDKLRGEAVIKVTGLHKSRNSIAMPPPVNQSNAAKLDANFPSMIQLLTSLLL
jgi:hypothetical protein